MLCVQPGKPPAPPPAAHNVGATNFAEAGTLSMEFSTVSHITGGGVGHSIRRGKGKDGGGGSGG